jgi:hypothetical protein
VTIGRIAKVSLIVTALEPVRRQLSVAPVTAAGQRASRAELLGAELLGDPAESAGLDYVTMLA